MSERDAKDLEQLRSFSAKNLKAFRERIGIDENMATRISALAADLSLSLRPFHMTSLENMNKIVADGVIYAHDTLHEMKKDHVPGMTFTKSSTSRMFNNVAHAPDKYTNFVYAAPVFNDVKSVLRTGLSLPAQVIGEDVWMSFIDPNQPTDRETTGWGVMHTKSFDESDVYAGQDIREAIALKALSYMANAHSVCVMKIICEDEDAASYAETLDKYIFGQFTEMVRHEDCARDLYWKNKDDHEDIMKEHGFPDRLGKFPAALFDQPEFKEQFEKTVNIVFKDIAHWGQIAFPRQLSAIGAETFILGEKQKTQQPAAPVMQHGK